MEKLIPPASILKPFATVALCLRSAWGFKLPALGEVLGSVAAEILHARRPNTLNCRAQLTKQQTDNSGSDVFTVDISGSIHAPTQNHEAIVSISVIDVTEGIFRAKPLNGSVEQYRSQASQIFSYTAQLGKLPDRITTMTDWMPVARVYTDWMVFPRKGKRKLRFNIAIISRETNEKLTSATCDLVYENNTFGYIDLRQNTKHIKNLAVSLAFAVSAADNNVRDCEVEVIKNWAKNNMDFSHLSAAAAGRKLAKALTQAVNYFRRGHRIDPHEICRKIVEIAPLADRYEILDLCLRVARANNLAAPEELELLKNVAAWLELDQTRFRSMAEKILPLSIHQVKDVEIILGVTPDMTKDQTRKHLRDEYRKWNARVTNIDPEVQAQAENMLRFIAQKRTQHA